MNDNRRKLTGILKLLYENTDAEHSMDTYQIMDALDSIGYGRPDRKTIDANIKFIIEDLGFGIKKEKGKPNRYRWVNREFDLSELKMLVDAVHSSRFITHRKSREIITKLKDLTSVHQAAYLNHELYTKDHFKRDGSEALKNTDIINEAIKARQRVRFMIACHDMDKNEFMKDNGKVYEVSPYNLIWSCDFYYMLGKPSDKNEIRAYRVDLMKETSLTHTEAAPAPHGFNIDDYASCVFDMSSGRTERVTLYCKADTMDDLIDRFGMGFFSERTGPDTFKAVVDADLSSSFYAWVFKSGGDITIGAPESARIGFKTMLENQLKVMR